MEKNTPKLPSQLTATIDVAAAGSSRRTSLTAMADQGPIQVTVKASSKEDVNDHDAADSVFVVDWDSPEDPSNPKKYVPFPL